MNFPALSRCLILVAITLSCCHQADGGKLGGIRGAARGKPKAEKKSSSSTRESENRSRRAPDAAKDHNDDDSDSTVLKLGQILGAVRQSSVSEASNREERSRRPTPPTRPRRPKPNRAQRRSPVAFNFYSHYAAPMPLPTVVEEYHYPVYEVAPAPPVVSYIETPNNAAEGKYLPATDCSVPPLADPPADQSPLEIDTSIDFDIHEPFQIRFEIDYATDEDEVDRSGFGLLLNATGGLGVESGLRIFRESYGEQRDHLWLAISTLSMNCFPISSRELEPALG